VYSGRLRRHRRGLGTPSPKLVVRRETPARREGREAPSLYSAHEQQPSIREFRTREEAATVRQDGIPDLAHFPTDFAVVDEACHSELIVEVWLK